MPWHWLYTCCFWNVSSAQMFSPQGFPALAILGKCLFKWLMSLMLGVGADLLLDFVIWRLVVLVPSIVSVLLSHFCLTNKAHALWFRTRLNNSAPVLQFAASHLGYLRLCLEMSYHPAWLPVALITLADLCKWADHFETSPKSGERCHIFTAAATECKPEQETFRNGHEFWGTVFFFPFILLNAKSGEVLDFFVLLKFDKSLWFGFICVSKLILQ